MTTTNSDDLLICSHHARLRLHLFGMVLDRTDLPDLALDTARAAYEWIVGEMVTVEMGDEPAPPPSNEPGKADMPAPSAPLADAIQAAADEARERPPVVGHGDDPVPVPVEIDRTVRRMLDSGMRVIGRTLAADLGIGQPDASGYLRSMEAAGILRREGGGNRVRFVLAATKPRRVPVIERGEATVTDLVANHREELLRRWLAGDRTAAMADHFRASKPTMARALAVAGISTTFRRGAGGRPEYEPLPADAPLPPEAVALLGDLPVEVAPPPPSEPSSPAPTPAPERAILPEDALARRDTPVDAAPADMETVEIWLAANGCKVSRAQEVGGEYRCDGTLMTTRELLAMANRARRSVNLPPFAVRRI